MNVWPVVLPIWLQEDNCSSGNTKRRDRHLLSESGDNFLRTISVCLLNGEEGVKGIFISVTSLSV